jgi:hypothetical protein
MFKNILQEQCQKNGVELPTYTEVACDGLPHQRIFKYVVEAFGWRAVGEAQSSKVGAQQSAAAALLSNENICIKNKNGVLSTTHATRDPQKDAPKPGKLVLIIDVENRPDVLTFLDVAREKVEEVDCIVVCAEKNAYKLDGLSHPLIRRVIVSSSAKDAADLACTQLLAQSLLAGEAKLVAVVTGDGFGSTACSVARDLFVDTPSRCCSISWKDSLSKKIDEAFNVE